MRRGSLSLIAAVLALAGFAPAPDAPPAAPAASTLSVDAVTCQTYTTWRFSCVADVSGGTGVYTVYEWDWPQSYFGPGGATTYVNEVDGHCGGGDGFVVITVTVRDSDWNTATGSGGMYCSYYG